MTADRLAALLDDALRPYLELLRSPDDQNGKIIRGVAARLAAAGVTVAPQKPTPESRRIGNGPTLGPLTPKQVRILDNRHHRVGNTVRCACGYDIWAFCEVHRLIETIDAAALAQPAPDALPTCKHPDIEGTARGARCLVCDYAEEQPDPDAPVMDIQNVSVVQPVGLDVERLTTAYKAVVMESAYYGLTDREFMAAIAREYGAAQPAPDALPLYTAREVREHGERIARAYKAAPDALRVAAQAYLDAEEALDTWDVAHGYAINSERDRLDGVKSEAREAMRAALAEAERQARIAAQESDR